MTLPVLCFAQVAVSTLTGSGGRGPGRASTPSPPAWVAPGRGRGAPATATQASQHAVDLRLLDRFLAEMQNAVSLSDTFTKAVFKSET